MGAEAEPAEAAPAERPEAEGPAGAGEEPGAAAEDPAENRARLQALVAKGERLSKEELREAQALIKAVEDLGAVGLEAPKRPSLPAKLEKLSASGRMRACQGFISAFQYNHTGEDYFNLCKKRPFARVMDTAKKMIRDALPIRCLEAVFLAAYLTCGMEDFSRIPISFKTSIDGHVYRHIVLAVLHVPSGCWGALGLSRRKELMYKELKFASFADLMREYKERYEQWWHKVLKIWVGLPCSHDAFDGAPICWRYCKVKLPNREWDDVAVELNKHCEEADKLQEKWYKGMAQTAPGGTSLDDT